MLSNCFIDLAGRGGDVISDTVSGSHYALITRLGQRLGHVTPGLHINIISPSHLILPHAISILHHRLPPTSYTSVTNRILNILPTLVLIRI